MLKSLISSARRVVTALADAVRETITAAAPVAETPAPVLADDPTNVFTEDEMPTEEEIEHAATSYAKALDQSRAGDRGKRAARKLLDRLPAGIYGPWIITRVESNRQVADLDAIRRIFKDNNLGPVPMRTPAPSLRVESMTTVPAPADATPVLATA